MVRQETGIGNSHPNRSEDRSESRSKSRSESRSESRPIGRRPLVAESRHDVAYRTYLNERIVLLCHFAHTLYCKVSNANAYIQENDFFEIFCRRKRLMLCNSNKKVSMCRESKFLTRHDLRSNFVIRKIKNNIWIIEKSILK